MTTTAIPRVDIATLNLGDKLGAGGQGQVIAVQGYRIGGQWPTALKMYSQTVLASLSVPALEAIVGMPGQLDTDQAHLLLEESAWPAAVAENHGNTCGFLMRTVPDEYYFNFQTKTQGARKKTAEVAYLLNPDPYVVESGLAISQQDRLVLLASLARTLIRWHALGIAIGDLSPKNLLFRILPSPNCFILDCDAIRLRGSTALEQVETPDWEAPAGEPRATAATDSYKFGLLAIRMFARDQSSRDQTAITALSPELGQLATLSQGLDPALRPVPSAWTAALDAAAAAASKAKPVFHPASPPTGKYLRPPSAATARPAAARTAAPARRRHRGLAAAVLAVIAAGAAIVIGNLATNAHSNSSAGAPVAVHAAGQRRGIVHIGGKAARSPQARHVAEIFNIYFSSINHHAYRRALSMIASDSRINPRSAATRQAFAHGLATTRDSHVVLIRLKPSADAVGEQAEVRFRSRQAPGYGPADMPDARCARWKIVYDLTLSATGHYRIYDVRRAHHSLC